MPKPLAVRRQVIVEARDLDTDARQRDARVVDQPTESAAQREQLREVVAALYPAARLRSFGGGAASFLEAQHLVVAHYGEPVAGVDEPAAEEPQAALFSA